MNNILALDVATKTGWCTSDSSGVIDLTLKRGESQGMKNLRLKSRLKDIIKLGGIDLVSYERPAGMHKSSIISGSKLIGVIELLCEELKIEYTSYSATEIKKYWTGKGNCNKKAMVDETKRRFPDLEIIDDNHADAIALYEFTKKDLK